MIESIIDVFISIKVKIKIRHIWRMEVYREKYARKITADARENGARYFAKIVFVWSRGT